MSLGALFGGLVGAWLVFTKLSSPMIVTVFGVAFALIALGRFLGAEYSARAAVSDGTH